MLFVSINLSLEKDSVVFSAFVNYNIILCIEFSSLRLKCDMGEFRPGHFRFCDLFERSKNLPKCFSLIVTFYILYPRFKINAVFMS